MSRSMTLSEWERVTASLDGAQHHHNSQQQRLFRLFQALRGRNLEQVERLLNDGAALDLALVLDENEGGVPAVAQFALQGVEQLSSLTALGYAAWQGDPQLLEWVLKRGASVGAVFAGGRDAAWMAMEANHHDLMITLLDRGAARDLRWAGNGGRTRLIDATHKTNLRAVSILLNRGINPNAADSRGRTALHHNFERDPYTDEDAEIGRMLIEWGGNPAAMDKDGNQLAHLANSDIQNAMLRQHGLEKKLRQVNEPEEEAFDPNDIVRPEAGDPGLPQLKNPPVFKKPRF